MEKIISGIQQVGIGVESVEHTWNWYTKHFGFSTKVFADEGVARDMLPYTGGKPQPRYAILALNMQGGGGFEVWEPRERQLNYPKEEIRMGDLGIYVCKIKARNIQTAYDTMKADGLQLLSGVQSSPYGIRHFFVKDPWGNLFQIEEDSYLFVDEKKITGGVNGVIIGVSDMERSIAFYSTLLDYDKVEYDQTGTFDDLKCLPGGERSCRRVLLSRTKPLMGPFCELLGTSHLELVQLTGEPGKKIYEGRLWGDPGFIHLCFDIRNMKAVEECAKSLGHGFVCDSGTGFDMGEANGRFTYVEDPDGALIEFVETYKVPILKKLGIYLNLTKRKGTKPLPRFITKALRFLK